MGNSALALGEKGNYLSIQENSFSPLLCPLSRHKGNLFPNSRFYYKAKRKPTRLRGSIKGRRVDVRQAPWQNYSSPNVPGYQEGSLFNPAHIGLQEVN